MSMEVNIKNHSDGKLVEVTDDLQLKTQAELHELEHYIAIHHGQAYHAQYIDTGITAKDQAILHIKNTDPERRLVITRANAQAITTTTFPNAGDICYMTLNETYTSGGTLVTPVNTYQATGKSAQATVYGNDPTLGGTATTLVSQAPSSNGLTMSMELHGALVLGLNDTCTIRYLSTTTGWARAWISFVMDDES